MKERLVSGSHTISGPERDQIKEIAYLWRSFYRYCVKSALLPPEQVDFVCEDFIQRPGSSGGKEGTSPERIAWGVEGYRMGAADEYKGRNKGLAHVPPMIWQHPSQAQASSERIKSWGCWIKGREHELSAFRHIAVRVGVLLKQR
jgi:hypothetical protein